MPRAWILRARADFEAVRTRGRQAHGRFMKVGAMRSEGETKVGIITSRRVGNAVRRNRARRQLREISRIHRSSVAPGTWMVIVVKKEAVEATYGELEAEWLRLMRKLSMVSASE